MKPDNDHPRHSARRERERLRYRGEILAAAAGLFARFGFERTSMRQIAERADISVGKLYNHFEGKEEIYRVLMDNHLRELHSRGDAACSPGDPPLGRLRSRIRSAIKHFKEHRDFMIIYHNENPLSLEGMVREEIRKNREIVAGLFAEAIERGDIPKEDPYVLAAMLIGAAHRLLDLLAEREGEDAFESVPGILDRLILNPLEIRGRDAPAMEGR
jgi:AcrR family transcriptional regulator